MRRLARRAKGAALRDCKKLLQVSSVASTPG
uniref:Uncharacterized protein n=1 Tax=Anopheles quadriannulatus TaxID=34691 RepID=A0A182XTV3_ANOQN